jgi:hypothetical protein
MAGDSSGTKTIHSFSSAISSLILSGGELPIQWCKFIAHNVCRVTTWPALENVTELCDMTRFIQTLDMCPFRANVTRLLAEGS